MAGQTNITDPLSKYLVNTLVGLSVESRGACPNDSSSVLAAAQLGIPTPLTEIVNREGATTLISKVGQPSFAVSNTCDSNLVVEISIPLRDSNIWESQSL
jgi:hypothetical protein